MKRLTAKKAGIKEIVTGKFIQKSGFESNYVLTNLGRKVSRLNLIALMVDKFISEDKNYGAITLDDGGETVRAKVFVNTAIFDGFNAGDLINLFGKVRVYNEEIYIVPEILRKVDANAETLRMLEMKKIYERQILLIKKIREFQKQTADVAELKVMAEGAGLDKESVEAVLEANEIIELEEEKKLEDSAKVKEKVLSIISMSEDGVEYQAILSKAGFAEDKVDSAVQNLLESGVCFEPKAGMIKLV